MLPTITFWLCGFMSDTYTLTTQLNFWTILLSSSKFFKDKLDRPSSQKNLFPYYPHVVFVLFKTSTPK